MSYDTWTDEDVAGEMEPVLAYAPSLLADGTPDWKLIHQRLTAPFPAEEVGHKPARGSGGAAGHKPAQGGGGTYAFITARNVQDRLDEVVGPQNWGTSYRVIDAEKRTVECTITIYGVSKSDVGGPDATHLNNPKAPDPWKTAYSDATKRAAVQWGVGRFLYTRKAQPAVRRSEQGQQQAQQQRPPQQERRPQQPSAPPQTQKNGAQSDGAARMALPQQIATIRKLHAQLHDGEVPSLDENALTYGDAAEWITTLSNDMKHAKGARS